jgi:hypothetical protein
MRMRSRQQSAVSFQPSWKSNTRKRDFLFARKALRNDILLRHCERSEALSAEGQLLQSVKISLLQHYFATG